jgi:hypothetical protein
MAVHLPPSRAEEPETTEYTTSATPDDNHALPIVPTEDVGTPGGGRGGDPADPDPASSSNINGPEVRHGTIVRLLISGDGMGVDDFLELKTYLKFFPAPNSKPFGFWYDDTIDSHAYVKTRTSEGVIMDYSVNSLSCVALMGTNEQLYLRDEN